MRIVLIGPMGAGKTTVGALLSNRFDFTLYDTDRIIEQRTKKTITKIFNDDGESYFREIESAILEELITLPKAIICTGGGVVLSSKNRKLLHGERYLIYLETSVTNQIARLKNDRTRPILNVNNKLEKLVELKNIRDPLYKEIAKININTNDLSAQNVFESIMEKLDLN